MVDNYLLYETNPNYTLYNTFYENSIKIILIIFLFILPIFFIRNELNNINIIKKKNPELKNKINSYNFYLFLYILYNLIWIYIVYSFYIKSSKVGGYLIILERLFLIILFSSMSIIIYSIYIINIYVKKKTYKDYNSDEKLILYSLITLILWCVLCIILEYTIPFRTLKNKNEIKRIKAEYRNKQKTKNKK